MAGAKVEGGGGRKALAGLSVVCCFASGGASEDAVIGDTVIDVGDYRVGNMNGC